MGGLCSRSSVVNSAPSGSLASVNSHFHHHLSGLNNQSYPDEEKEKQATLSPTEISWNEGLQDSSTYGENSISSSTSSRVSSSVDIYDGIPRLSRAGSYKPRPTKRITAATTKVTEVSSILGRAGTAGLGKAVEVLDVLGSSMTNLNPRNGFGSGTCGKGNKISILAFEVANTIVKGSNLMHSLTKESIAHLKEVVLPTEAVRVLISEDMDELLRISATDKKEELKVFSCEVVRFGNRCKDPQWHNLDRYFDRLLVASELVCENRMKEEAETSMQDMMLLVHYTAELYHELHALDRFEQDYRRKLQEEDTGNPTQRESIVILRSEVKSQRKHVKSLKKKSLWWKGLEEIMEKLVVIVHFLRLEIDDAFGSIGDPPDRLTLGTASLALHYANIITQIETLVSRSSSVPPNTRDALYQGLPPSVKSALRSKLLASSAEEQNIPKIRAAMERTMKWLVPVASNTTKAHHGFGWVGEWANSRTETNKKAVTAAGGGGETIRIETLHHASKEKTEGYILDLVVWLNQVVSRSRCGACSPVRTLSVAGGPGEKPRDSATVLTPEDEEMLEDVGRRRPAPGISKSQEIRMPAVLLHKTDRLCRSINHSPLVLRSSASFANALDLIDRVDTVYVS